MTNYLKEGEKGEKSIPGRNSTENFQLTINHKET